MKTVPGRRLALTTMALGTIASITGLPGRHDATASELKPSLLPRGAERLEDLIGRLGKLPRRRDFKTVPMILNDPDQWDHAALSEVISYRGAMKQVWDNTEIAGPWLNVMRNAVNSQVWSFGHPDFLVVSATHGTAHLSLFTPVIWEKYQLTRLTGGKMTNNTLMEDQTGAAALNYEDPEGVFSAHDNSIRALQRRGVVFLACHNAIWEIAQKLITTNVNPDNLSHEALAAELSNHLIDNIILTPGIAGTLAELHRSGFGYASSTT
jgi:hypothetical protein